jgi:hypothetical protein
VQFKPRTRPLSSFLFLFLLSPPGGAAGGERRKRKRKRKEHGRMASGATQSYVIPSFPLYSLSFSPPVPDERERGKRKNKEEGFQR